MVMTPLGLTIKNDCADEGQQQFTRPDQLSNTGSCEHHNEPYDCTKDGEFDELRDCQLLKKNYVPCYVPNIRMQIASYVGFVFTAVTMKNVASCSLVGLQRIFGGVYCFHLQGQKVARVSSKKQPFLHAWLTLRT
jgi:hypothetical protein